MRFDRFAAAALLAMGVCTAAHAQNGTKPDQANAAPQIDVPDLTMELDTAMAGEIDRLIIEIGSPDYHEREAATRRLLEIGVPAFAKLRDAYHVSDDLEVRLRTEVIVRDAYLNHQVFDRTGYLGIQRTPGASPTNVDDARIPIGSIGIKLGKVVAKTAAAKARLKVDDVIIQLDGQPLGNADMHPNDAFGSFAKTIRDRGAGSKLRLTVLRRDRRLEVDVVLGAAPKENVNLITGLRALYNRSNSEFYTWWVNNFSTSPPSVVEPGVGKE